MGQLQEPGLHYIEVMCESILHGMYTVLIAGIVWLLVTPRSMPKLYRVMFWAGIVMWMLASTHLGLVVQRAINPDVILVANSQTSVVIATIQLLIGDMILIWRVWAVWGRNYWVALIPFLLMISAAGVRFAIVGKNTELSNFQSDVSSELIVANTVLCTGLIAGRIWYSTWQNNKLLGHSPSRTSHIAYRGLLMLIIETGLLITLCQILSVILDKIHNDGIHTILDVGVPLTGMLPTLIVLFVYLELVPGTRVTQSYQSTISSGFQAAAGPMGTTVTIGGAGSRQIGNSTTDAASDDADDAEFHNEKPSDLHYTSPTEATMV